MPLIIPSNSISGEFEVANSLRFDDGSSDYLNRTPSSAGSRTTWTWSAWVKRSDIAPTSGLFEAYDSSGNFTYIRFAGDYLRILNIIGGSLKAEFNTSAFYRDPSAWYHIVWTWDTTNGTAGDRSRLYVNGTRITNFSTETNPTSGEQSFINNNDAHYVGSTGVPSLYMNGYMAEVCFIDGQALDPTSFGEFDEDTGIWKPKAVSGLTFGTNGFYLDFENSGSLGADVSGNGNNFTVNNLTSIDQTTDTPTNNFCTMNPLDNYYASSTFSEGNCKIVTDASNFASNSSTFGVNSGKWYCEIKAVQIYNGYAQFGIRGKLATATNDKASAGTDGYIYTASGGNKVNNSIASSYGTVWNNNDIIGIALDLDNNYLYFSRNGTWQNSGDPESGSSGTGAAFSLGTPSSGFYYIVCSDNDSGSGSANTYEFNFGNPPFTISSGNSDGNGMGNFEYSVPSGYYSLNTKNLSEFG